MSLFRDFSSIVISDHLFGTEKAIGVMRCWSLDEHHPKSQDPFGGPEQKVLHDAGFFTMSSLRIFQLTRSAQFIAMIPLEAIVVRDD